MYSLNARDHFNCSPLLFSWPAPQNRCGQTEGGRKYWQLNQSNEHASNYSRIKQRQRMRRYILNIHKKPRINKQERQKITFLDLLTPRRSPSSTLPLHTQKQCTARGSSWGSSILISDHLRLLDPPWGEGRQTSRHPTDTSTPSLECSSCAIRFIFCKRKLETLRYNMGQESWRLVKLLNIKNKDTDLHPGHLSHLTDAE